MTGHYKYKNYYTLRTVHVNGVDREDYTITCLVRNQSGVIQEYFVTQQYNANIIPNKLPVLARFIFSRDLDNQLLLRAMAEEPAVALDSYLYHAMEFAEFMYIVSRKRDRPSK